MIFIAQQTRQLSDFRLIFLKKNQKIIVKNHTLSQFQKILQSPGNY